MPWKNGRGSTLEIASDAASPGAEWSWRVSVADVPESGPFSHFHGCRRWIACVDGPGMQVVIDHAPPRDVPRDGAGLAFSGDATTTGLLVGGPVRDANLIVRAERWTGGLAILRGSRAETLPPASHAVVYVVAGQAELHVAGRSSVVADGEGARISDVGEAAATVHGSAEAVVVMAWVRPAAGPASDSAPSAGR